MNQYEYYTVTKLKRRAKRNRKQADNRKDEYGKQRLENKNKRVTVREYEDIDTEG